MRSRTFKHILVPVWLVNYTFGPKTFQVLVNGYTGSTAGDRPVSWVKVFFYIVIPAIMVLIIIALVNSQEADVWTSLRASTGTTNTRHIRRVANSSTSPKCRSKCPAAVRP